MRNWGMVIGVYDVETCKLTLESNALVTTSHCKDLPLPKNLKDVAASQVLYKENKTYLLGVDIIVAEIPIGSKSASAMISYGLCIGVLGSLAQNNIPLVRVTPQAVKRIIGNAEASKHDVMQWVLENHPEIVPPTRTMKNGKTQVITTKFEHIADAVVAIHAALATTEFHNIVKNIRNVSMKVKAVLSTLDLSAAVIAHVTAQNAGTVTDEVVFLTNADGETEAHVTLETDGQTTAVATGAAKATRTRRASATTDVAEEDEEQEEEVKKPVTRRRKPAAVAEEEPEVEEEDDEAEAKPATTRRRAASTTTRRKPAAPVEDAEEEEDDVEEEEAKPVTRRRAPAAATTTRRRAAAKAEPEEDEEDYDDEEEEVEARPVTRRRTLRK